MIKNHPFTGGNKRTATHLTETFLYLNGCEINSEIKDVVEMVLVVESDAWKVNEIENWLRERIVKYDA